MPKRVKPKSTSPVVCIQAINTHWTKQSRGGSGAVLRNRVPETLSLPSLTDMRTDTACLSHQVSYREENCFSEPYQSKLEAKDSLPLEIGGVRLLLTENVLEVGYSWDWSQGAPLRYTGYQSGFVLQPGQWGRVLYNGRFSAAECDWWYEKWVYNIGLLADIQSNVFTHTQPIKIYSQMKLLR